MIKVETYLFNAGRKIGYVGHGRIDCPYCGADTDVGTGEHSNPDVTLCSCGKWFRYFSTGRTQKARQSNYN